VIGAESTTQWAAKTWIPLKKISSRDLGAFSQHYREAD
jgi:hypothetical protein